MMSSSKYTSALLAYESGHYPEARELFGRLALELPQQPAVWQGLAAADQRQGHYQEALLSWAVAAMLDTQDAIPHFHAAECLLAAGDVQESSFSIRLALSLPCSEELLARMVQLKEIIDQRGSHA